MQVPSTFVSERTGGGSSPSTHHGNPPTTRHGTDGGTHRPRFDRLGRVALLLALLVLATFATATTAAEPQPPLGAADVESAAVQALGPGEPDDVPVVAAACPTFHWGISAEGTPAAIELRVSRLAEATDELEARPVLERRLPGPSRLWTPYVGDCLERGGVYAWWVRTLDRDGEPGPWSETRVFQVLERPETAGAEASLPAGVPTAESREGPGVDSGPERSPRRPRARRDSARTESAASLAGATVAISGKRSETSGNAIGVVGETASPDGAGVAAANADPGGGSDLLLDGAAQGVTDTILTESGLDRPSGGAEVFEFRNSGAGSLSLRLDGADLLTEVSSVDWNNLINVPAGLDDGDDDTTYAAGTGLVLGGATFSVDSSVVARKDSSGGDQSFDGGTLFLDYDNDRVGIGDVSPSHPLDVNGSIRADELRYRTAVTRYHPVPGIAFQTNGHSPRDVRRISGYEYLSTDESASTYESSAEVHLPDGAVVESLTCYAYDDDPDNSAIWKYFFSSQSYTQKSRFNPFLPTIDSSGASTSILSATDSASSATINNEDNKYFVALEYERDFGSSNSFDLRNYGCRIEYTLEVVSTP